uniref:Bm8812 n=1 Tax=Brugia malayi TaxID=6279 RepID=A0A1I9GCQ4_BRUMA|nr:Bm8812 [Brugia malayi]
MQTDDHSGFIPSSVPDVDCTTSSGTATATTVVAAAPQSSESCSSVESNFTNGMLLSSRGLYVNFN